MIVPKPRRPKRSSPTRTRTSAAKGVRLRDAFGAEGRRDDRYWIQELKNDSTACLINSAGPSTYPPGKSVRTTRATAVDPATAEAIADWQYGCRMGYQF